MNKPILQVKDLTLKLGSVTVLDNINLEVNYNEIVSIIGLNGTGKTSLLKTILGVYKPTSGEIILNTDKIGYIPQKLDFDRSFPMSVKEFIELYANVRINLKDPLLEDFNLQDILYTKVGALSGGQLQRVIIVTTLLKRPKILFLDEPTTGLDVSGEQKMYQMIERIYKDYKLTIVLVSHDIHNVFALSTKVVCLNKHICCIGDPSEVKKSKEFESIFGEYLVPYNHHHKHEH